MLTRLYEGKRHYPPTFGESIEDMLNGLGGLCNVRNPFLLLLLRALDFENVRFVIGTMCPPGREKLQMLILPFLFV